MARFGVVVLNYLAYKNTVDCVDSILKCKRPQDELLIVIVDNNSSNLSFEYLKDYYKNKKNVIVAETNNNIGFAKGNNFGFAILSEKFDFDFLIVSNDDIFLKDDRLFEWIEDSYKKKKFGILGPDIYSKRYMYHQSPLNDLPIKPKDCLKFIRYLKRKKCIEFIKSCVRAILRIKPKTNKNKNSDSKWFKEEVPCATLHGSFLIFHVSYFNEYNEPFDNRTFLYGEEDLLRLRCLKSDILSLYLPDYQVVHLQDTSSFVEQKKDYYKEYKRLCRQIESINIYYSSLKSIDC